MLNNALLRQHQTLLAWGLLVLAVGGWGVPDHYPERAKIAWNWVKGLRMAISNYRVSGKFPMRRLNSWRNTSGCNKTGWISCFTRRA